MAWPDPKQFVDEAWGVGKLRYKRLTNLIGYCCDGDERLLVAGNELIGSIPPKAAEFKAMQAQAETERQKVIYDEQKKLAQQQAQIKSQMARYEDELAKKRMQNFTLSFTFY